MKNRRKRYFIKQKLMGLLVFALATFSITIEGDATAAILLAPMGLLLIFTKKMIWCDSYYEEVKSRSKRAD